MCFISDSLKVLILHSLSPLSEYSSLRQRDDLPQASQVGLSMSQHGLCLVELGTVLPEEMQLFSHDQGDDIELMRSLVLEGILPARAFRREREKRLVAQHLVKLAQVVETDRWLLLLLQTLPDLDIRVQIAQQSIADAALRQAPQLALGRAQHGQWLALLAHLQHQRERTGKPAHRAREIDVSKQRLPPVPFQLDGQGRAAKAVGAGQRQGAQQHLLHVGTRTLRHLPK